MKIFKKLLNSNKLKRFNKISKEYRYFIEDSIFYFFSFFFTINKKANLKIITASDSKFYDSLIYKIEYSMMEQSKHQSFYLEFYFSYIFQQKDIWI